MRIQLSLSSRLALLLFGGCCASFGQANYTGPIGHWNMGSCANTGLMRVFQVQQSSNGGVVVHDTCYKVVNNQFTRTNEGGGSFALAGCSGSSTLRCSQQAVGSVTRDAPVSTSECRNRMGTSGISPKDRGYSDFGCTSLTKKVSERVTWTNDWVLSANANSISIDISVNDPQNRSHKSLQGIRLGSSRK